MRSARVETPLTPKELFDKLQEIEQSLGKTPKPKQMPRPIDFDLLFYGTLVYADSELTIPHPHWRERLFVLVPLSDLTDTLSIEGESFKLKDLIQLVGSQTDQTVSLLDKKIELR